MNDHVHVDDVTVDEVKDHLPEYADLALTRSRGKFYVCPFCESGKRGSKTGALSINRKDESNGRLWHCFSCRRGGDIFTLIMKVENVDYYGALQYGVDLYARGALSQPAKKKQPPEAPKPALTREQIKRNADRFEAALKGSEGEQYLLGRGIDLAAQMRFHLGYDAKKRAIVIPFGPNKTYYTERRIDPDGKHSRHSNISGVEVPVYNAGALRTGEPFIFVTEAAIDAISIMCAGGTAIALSGTDPTKLVKKLIGTQPAYTLLLCLDNDDAGKTATEATCQALTAEVHVQVVDVAAQIMTDWYDGVQRIARKDPNEVLQHDGVEVLRNRIHRCIEHKQTLQRI